MIPYLGVSGKACEIGITEGYCKFSNPTKMDRL